MTNLKIPKRVSWIIRSIIGIAFIVLSYMLWINISAQSEINKIYDAATNETKDICKKQVNFHKTLIIFNMSKRHEYNTCIVKSEDPAFKKAAALYVLKLMEQNGDTQAAAELKNLIK